MKEDHTNELSWLNENSCSSSSSSSRAHENLNGSSTISRTTLLPKVENNVPSWALEDNSVDDDDTRSYESKDTRRSSIQPINVKWKNNKKGLSIPAEIHSGSTPKDDDEEEDWRCCPSDPVLVCFQCFHFTSGVNGLLALLSNAYVVYTLHDLPINDLVIHGYAIVFCLLIVCIELDWRYIVSKVKFLDLWVLRGLYYIFVGVITANNMRSQSIEHIAVTSQRVMGIVLCSYGGCYILMALFCLKSVKEHHMRMQDEQYMAIDDR